MDITEKIAENRRRRDELATQITALDDELAGPDGLIRQALAEGHTGPQIAKIAHLSKQRVYQIRDGSR